MYCEYGRMATKTTIAAYLQNNYNNLGGGYQYEDGMSLTFVYRLDAENYEQKEFTATSRLSDGSETPYEHNVNSYDVAIPAPTDADSPPASFFDGAKGIAGTFTLIFAPGTAKEHSSVFDIPANTSFDIWYDGVEPDVYEDAACTQLFNWALGGRTDLRLYIKGAE